MVTIPGTKLGKPLELPGMSVIKVSFVILIR